jgi:hypothetical protein
MSTRRRFDDALEKCERESPCYERNQNYRADVAAGQKTFFVFPLGDLQKRPELDSAAFG